MKYIKNRPQLAQDIILARKEKGLTQQQLASAAGFPLNTIKRIEAGTYKPPYSIISKIAPILDLNAFSLMGTDSRYDQSTGFSEYVDRDYNKIKKLFPTNYHVIEGGIPSESNSENDLEIIYSEKDMIISTPYTKLELIDAVNKIKEELDAQYHQELLNRVQKLFEEILPPPKENS